MFEAEVSLARLHSKDLVSSFLGNIPEIFPIYPFIAPGSHEGSRRTSRRTRIHSSTERVCRCTALVGEDLNLARAQSTECRFVVRRSSWSRAIQIAGRRSSSNGYPLRSARRTAKIISSASEFPINRERVRWLVAHNFITRCPARNSPAGHFARAISRMRQTSIRKERRRTRRREPDQTLAARHALCT